MTEATLSRLEIVLLSPNPAWIAEAFREHGRELIALAREALKTNSREST